MPSKIKIDWDYALKVAEKHNANLVVVHKDHQYFNGYPCTCGYHLEEGDYRHKGDDLDYSCYVCEKCGYLLVVYNIRLPKECELSSIIEY